MECGFSGLLLPLQPTRACLIFFMSLLPDVQHRPSGCEEDEEEASSTAAECVRGRINRFSCSAGRRATAARGLASTRQPSWFGLGLRSRSGSHKRGNGWRIGATAAPYVDVALAAICRLRGGDASQSSSSSGNKGDGAKADVSWGLNLNVFGWGGDSEAEAEAKAEKKRKAKQDMEEAEAREAMRIAREER